MADNEQALLKLFRDFTAKIEALFRGQVEASVAAIANSAAAGLGAAVPKAGRRPPTARPPRGARATPQPTDTEAVAAQVLSFVEATPEGLRVEELSRKLEISTDEVKPIVKKLVVDRRLRSKGQARGTRYFLGTKGLGRKATPSKVRGKRGGKRAK